MFDVIIAGGGPAGLSAALVLGRCRRNILLFDDGQPRNRSSAALHAFLTRDGIRPFDFLELARHEISRYGVNCSDEAIIKISPASEGFVIIDNSGQEHKAKKILIATGLTDIVPDINGIKELYGKSVFHCPYCDAWEFSDRPMAVLAQGKAAYVLSLSMKTWSSDIMLFTNGQRNMPNYAKQVLNEAGILIHTQKISLLEGQNGKLTAIKLLNGNTIPREVLFFSSGQQQHSNIGVQLGCRFSKKGDILTNKKQETSVKGVFAAGDASRDMKFVIVAAAEGAKAGAAINMALQEEEKEKFKKFLA